MIFTVLAFFAAVLVVNSAVLIRMLGPRLAPAAIFHLPCTEKLVALTIDDGPDASTTPKILDLLLCYRAAATFFVIGERAEAGLLRQIVYSGSELGNHTDSDTATVSLASADRTRSIDRTDDLIRAHQKVVWFRPGQGRYDRRLLRLIAAKGYRLVLADVFPWDHWVTSTWLKAAYILYSTRPGSIIVLHDYGERGLRTLETLQCVLPKLSVNGYRVVSLSELARHAARVDTD